MDVKEFRLERRSPSSIAVVAASYPTPSIYRKRLIIISLIPPRVPLGPLPTTHHTHYCYYLSFRTWHIIIIIIACYYLLALRPIPPSRTPPAGLELR